MSGTGKSHWSSVLEEQGFRRFCCDDLIAERLGPELTAPTGETVPMGEWMGFPFEAKYEVRQRTYMAYEIEIMHEILAYLESSVGEGDDNIVVDTTGSVIYTGLNVLERLHHQTEVVYLEMPLAVQDQNRIAYLRDPAPMLWFDKFDQQPGETDEAALARCYPILLASRSAEYRRWADITLDYHRLREEGFTSDNFLADIAEAGRTPDRR
jgi:hypothetical protein